MSFPKNKTALLWMAPKKLARVLCMLTLAIPVAGCLSGVNLGGPPGACPSSPVIMEKTLARDARLGTMKALADLEIQSIGRRYPVRLAIMAKRPAALRMEALPPIGTPDFMLSIKGDDLRVFLPGKGEFYTGDASRHLSLFVPIPIDVRDIVSILMGACPPLREGDCFAPAAPDGDLQQIRILSKEGKVRMTLWLKGPERVLVRIETGNGYGNRDYSAVFSDYTLVDQIPAPEKIVIKVGGMAGIGSTITIRYSDLEFTNGEDESIFELPVPPGVHPTQLHEEKRG